MSSEGQWVIGRVSQILVIVVFSLNIIPLVSEDFRASKLKYRRWLGKRKQRKLLKNREKVKPATAEEVMED